ncbi:growth arrest-specific protein 1 [Fopius arisanus]|uniref:Gas1 protein n=1 Tax=Fopius arisanus TaxID=64838 RepID=A0A0C9QKG8_9HYME|nr:PREDICTED: growth arrest-specific protein 1-like [Fopius arisanus]
MCKYLESEIRRRRMSRKVQWSFMLSALMVLTVVAADDETNTTGISISCENARVKCAFRSGCGTALQQYIGSCASDLRGGVTSCPETCLLTLIALSSTDEGKQLMTCTCSESDSMCIRSKQRVEVCRASVLNTLNKTRVSCKIATTICNADTICSTALSYYHLHCRSMIHGKKCTHRCKNSIDILSRQEKAAKLNTCLCDGAEDHECREIHRNMNNLCFGRNHHDYTDHEDTDHDTIPAGGLSTIAEAHLILGLVLLVYISQD